MLQLQTSNQPQETRQFGMILLLLVAVDAIGIDTKGTISAF
jgi:hypothetical protein